MIPKRKIGFVTKKGKSIAIVCSGVGIFRYGGIIPFVNKLLLNRFSIKNPAAFKTKCTENCIIEIIYDNSSFISTCQSPGILKNPYPKLNKSAFTKIKREREKKAFL